MLTQGELLRQKRLSMGVSQAAMAQRLGVSAAYLNLIEHNRRRMGGAIKQRVHQDLGVDLDTLERGGPNGVIDDMLLAASQVRDAADGPSDQIGAQEVAVRHPFWAHVIADQLRKVNSLEEQVARLQDRVGHDATLEDALHEMLSKVTSIRSMAAILGGTEDVSVEWLQRFHRNIDEDGRQLAVSAQALAEYLTQVEQSDPDLQTKDAAWFWRNFDFYLPQLERSAPDFDAILDEAQLTDRDARFAVLKLMRLFHQDAQLLPEAEFQGRHVIDAEDVITLAQARTVPMTVVLRRLALHPSQTRSGLVVSDHKLAPVFVKPLNNFDPQLSQEHLCSLWPIFDGGLIESGFAQVPFSIAGAPLGRYVAQSAGHVHYEHRRSFQTRVMRVLPRAGDQAEAREVGLRCRLCPKQACSARTIPAFDS